MSSELRRLLAAGLLGLALPLGGGGCGDTTVTPSLHARIEPVSFGGNMVVLLGGHTSSVGWHGTLATGAPADCTLTQDRSVYASEAAAGGDVPLILSFSCAVGERSQVFGALSLGDLRDASDGALAPAVDRSFLTADSTPTDGGPTDLCTSDASGIHLSATVSAAAGGRATAPQLTSADFHRHVEVQFELRSNRAGVDASGVCAAPATFTGSLRFDLDATSYTWVRE